MENRCMNCMTELGSFEVCWKCGWVIGSPPKEPCQLWPSTLLADRYEIGTAVGFGGFGVVYRAWDQKLNVLVAVKEYFPSGLATRSPGERRVISYSGEKEEFYHQGMERFLSEARTMARFSGHPDFVQVIDFFEENGTAYIVMEFLEGGDLKGYLKQVGGRLPTENAVAMILPVLEALKELHREGIIHRDISPDNIFVLGDGRVKITDLGAARLSDSGQELTRSIILKPGYAPPEQYRSKSRQGPFTDLYAVGGVLYRMLTGILPEESSDRVIEDHLLPPSQINVVVPEWLDRVVMRALSLNPDFRFQSAEEFEKALRENSKVTLPEEEIHTIIKKRKWIAVIASALTVLALAAGLTTLRLRSNRANLTPIQNLNPAAITVWVPDGQESSRLREAVNIAQEQMVKDFGDKGVPVTVTVTKIPANEIEHRIEAAAASGELPDLFCSPSISAALVETTADLTPLTDSLKSDAPLFLDRYRELFPQLRQIPLGFHLPVMYYDNNLLTSYNISFPHGRSALDSIVRQLGPVTEYDVCRLAVGPEQYTALAAASGGQILLEDNEGGLSLAYDEAAEAALKEAQAAELEDGRDYSVSPIQLFQQGTLAAYLGDSREFSQVQAALPGYYGVAPLPGDGPYYGAFSGFLWSVSSQTDQNRQEISMWLLSYLLSEHVQNYLYVQNIQGGGDIPLNQNAFSSYLEVNTELSFIQDYLPQITFLGELQAQGDQENAQRYRRLVQAAASEEKEGNGE